MKADEYIKKYGLVCANIKVAEMEHTKHFDGLYFELKRIIESHELVDKYKNRHGGIRFRIRWGMYRYGDTQEFNERLKQAIADVESCQ